MSEEIPPSSAFRPSGGPGFEVAQKASDTANRYRMFVEADVVVVGVSGGPDSMCLLHVLTRMRPELSIAVAHVDHRLSDDSEEVSARVAEYAAKEGYDVHIVRAPDLAGSNLHARAREFRYSFFESLGQRLAPEGRALIATGHTLDDRVETTLARLVHGAGTDQLAGIHPKADDRIRPLIHVRRPETRAYCEQVGLPFYDDPANEDPRFERAEVRLLLATIEERWGDGAVRAMATTSERLRDDSLALSAFALGLYRAQVETKERDHVMSLESVRSWPRALTRRVLELCIPAGRDRSAGIDEVLEALERDRLKPDARFDIAGGTTIAITDESLVVTPGGPEATD